MFAFLKSAISEDDGKCSFGRVGAGILIAASIFWITFLVLNNKALPDLAGLALFIAVPYGISKGASAVADFKKPG